MNLTVVDMSVSCVNVEVLHDVHSSLLVSPTVLAHVKFVDLENSRQLQGASAQTDAFNVPSVWKKMLENHIVALKHFMKITVEKYEPGLWHRYVLKKWWYIIIIKTFKIVKYKPFFSN